MNSKILIVEDEEKLARILTLVLTDNGFEVKSAPEGAKGMALWNQWQPHAVITDLKMKPVGGMEVLRFGRLNYPHIPVIILTAFGSIETAVTAMKQGAFDFLAKPVDHEQLLEIVAQALTPGENHTETRINDLQGASRVMEKVRKNIRLFSATDSSVLILGESGTGKDIAARAIHSVSPRRSQPFVKVNCAAIPRELMESELFGHKKGAFTGAVRDRDGAFVRADKGVLFLDEIGDMPLELQAKLLQAVEEKKITPVGSGTPITVSVKIVSATNQDLESMIADKRFRSDLYFRLNTVTLSMPSLRDKKEDIEELASSFVETFILEFDRPGMTLGGEVLACLNAYDWPGNVRELKNTMERAVITSESASLTVDLLPRHIRQFKPVTGGRSSGFNNFDMASHEQGLLIEALKECAWNQTCAAKKLGITRGALRYRIKKYGIHK